ncbi:nucleotidyltransferase family protein [Meiothermus sp. CFH 77666]|uniref:nucleotidyltransferase family protein n=1 Tax=Meiothermus sp. CFH 77666 TaxID=2817942 RepID=UPI001AA05BE0|nr:nucleotidyltransferase family protein [Meiothermus sp. CFH 77666]MBO1437815.1 nucleotidyltransferase family protein [Meiothermus sp. CFH 77666]
MMEALSEQTRTALAELCREYGVVRLEMFGSAARGDAGPGSDVDLLVRFAPGVSLGPWLSRYFELKERLEALLGRKVDLITDGGQLKPRFLEAIQRDRVLLYGESQAVA